MKNNYKNNLNKAVKTTTVDTWLAIIHLIRRSPITPMSIFKSLISCFNASISVFVALVLLTKSAFAALITSDTALACSLGIPDFVSCSTNSKVSKVNVVIVSLYHKTKKQLYTLVIALLLSSTTWAFVVTDPTSYGYYVEQLKTAVKQVEAITRVSSELDKIVADGREVFNFSTQIQSTLGDELKAYQKYRDTLTPFQKKQLDFNRKYDPQQLRDIIDTNLDGIYVDPDDPIYHTTDIKKKRNFERQRLLKEALIKTETELASVKQKYDRLHKLADETRKTKSKKAALDLNNTILLEILAALNTQIEIMSKLGQAEMASKYIHYNQDKHKETVDIDKRKYPNGYSFGGIVFPSKDYFLDIHRPKCWKYQKLHGHDDVAINGYDCFDRVSRKKREALRAKEGW